jgi:glycosyltransferase involved in cell wall biosynthesis
MLRIGIDARYLGALYSGIGVYSANLLRALSRLESPYEHIVFVHESFQRKLDLGENFKIVRLSSKPLSRGTFFGETLRAYEEARLDLLHCHFPLLPVGWQGPTIVTLHDLQPFVEPNFTGKRLFPIRKAYDLFYRWAYPSALGKAQVIVCDSRATQNTLYSLFPATARKSVTIRPGLDEFYLEPKLKNDELDNVRLKYRLPDRFILYIGSTRPNKNLPNMLRGFARYIQQHPDDETAFAMVLARDRFWRESERLIETLNLSERVLVIDQVKHREKRALYLMAQALFFATKHEGFGFPVLEAQASECPVIASDDASLPEIGGNSVFYADPDDPEDLAQALNWVLNDAEIRAKLQTRGRVNCRRFSWEECAKRVQELYRCLYDPEQFLSSDMLEPTSALVMSSNQTPSRHLLD